MAPEAKPALPDVREGDEWVFRTNNGCITRKVVMIGTDRIGYTAGRGPMRSCLKSTFMRWVRGATLEFAKDWSGR